MLSLISGVIYPCKMLLKILQTRASAVLLMVLDPFSCSPASCLSFLPACLSDYLLSVLSCLFTLWSLPLTYFLHAFLSAGFASAHRYSSRGVQRE